MIFEKTNKHGCISTGSNVFFYMNINFFQNNTICGGGELVVIQFVGMLGAWMHTDDEVRTNEINVSTLD